MTFREFVRTLHHSNPHCKHIPSLSSVFPHQCHSCAFRHNDIECKMRPFHCVFHHIHTCRGTVVEDPSNIHQQQCQSVLQCSSLSTRFSTAFGRGSCIHQCSILHTSHMFSDAMQQLSSLVLMNPSHI